MESRPYSEEQTPSMDLSDPTSLLSARSDKKKLKVAGSFVHSPTEQGSHRHCGDRLRGCLSSFGLANFMTVVVLIDAYCTCVDIDATAAETVTPEIYTVISTLCLMAYTLEVTASLAAFGWKHFFSDWMVLLDLIIVGCGWAEQLMSSLGSGDFAFRTAVLRALRLVRIFRLMRSLKRVRALRELYRLAIMMATCIKALLWCFLLCFAVMTVWAMLMVEVVNPYVREMHQDHGFFSSCHPQCTRAVSSVMDANLLLFKTVIAGDSWGEVAVPVIEEHPVTAIVFIGSLLTLVFGVLNLIVAVVVDTFADARMNDIHSLAEEMEDEIEHDRKELAKLFKRMDQDGSGQLTLQELMEGARTDSSFQSRLRVMDIDVQDLEQLFCMIDQDRSGTVEVSEFIGPLSRWAHDSKTAPRFIKYNLMQTMNLQEELHEIVLEGFRQLAVRIDSLTVPAMVKENPVDVRATPSDSAALQYPSSVEGAYDMEPGVLQPPCSPHPVDFLTPLPPASSKTDVLAVNTIQAMLDSAMVRLEAKLDVLLAGNRARPKEPMCWQGAEDDERLEQGRRKSFKRTPNVATFQKMYMEKGRSATQTDERPPKRRSRQASSEEGADVKPPPQKHRSTARHITSC
ncbi:Scn11a [Symbiodinium natans]|uniref:Scn11a protein n=1 Tax=Symbiodinium natans TaxID=878477 RepID=A0A812J6X7_9DINO|nr:Scn11a [Symbiodinium natans]